MRLELFLWKIKLYVSIFLVIIEAKIRFSIINDKMNIKKTIIISNFYDFLLLDK